ncbi:hypothetical protein MHU86_4819 [Fragilaria crotonensis]|nr:hypothetical protein MHU86_4819 [Fragilaria crotonensis]
MGRKLPWATGRDGVVASAHAEGGCIVTVPFRFVKTRDGRMVALGTESMCPAIKHFPPFNGDMTCRSRWCWGWSDGSSSDGWGSGSCGGGRNDGIVSAVEPGIASGEAANAFLVPEDEISLKRSNSPFGDGTETEFFCRRGQEASFSIIAKVSVMIVMSAIGTAPKERHVGC